MATPWKYEEYHTAFANKALKAIKALMEPGLSDIVRFSERESNEYFETVADQLWQEEFDNPNLSIGDIVKKYYVLQIYAKGKFFRFVEKNSDVNSPIYWINSEKEVFSYYNPTFTFINGEIVHATF